MSDPNDTPEQDIELEEKTEYVVHNPDGSADESQSTSTEE